MANQPIHGNPHRPYQPNLFDRVDRLNDTAGITHAIGLAALDTSINRGSAINTDSTAGFVTIPSTTGTDTTITFPTVGNTTGTGTTINTDSIVWANQSITAGTAYSFYTPPVGAQIIQKNDELIVVSPDQDTSKDISLTKMARQIDEIHKMLSELSPAIIDIARQQKRQASRLQVGDDLEEEKETQTSLVINAYL